MLCVIMLIVLSFLDAFAKDIAVSNSATSKDLPNCGQGNRAMCRSIEYAIYMSSKDDNIVLKCPEKYEELCGFTIGRKTLLQNSVNIMAGENENQQPTIYFQQPEGLGLVKENTVLTFTNLTIHLSYSIASAERHKQSIIFNKCKLILKKDSYTVGVGKILQLVPVAKSARSCPQRR